VRTLVEEVEKNQGMPAPDGSGGVDCVSTDFGLEPVYNRFHHIANSHLQLKRNSLWLFEVEIAEVLDGMVETNRAFVAMRPTRAFFVDMGEEPSTLSKFSDAQLVLGLVRLDDDEFKKSFQGLVCYVKNDPRFYSRSDFTDPLDGCVLTEDCKEFFDRRNFSPSPCYVAREIGIQSENGVKIVESLPFEFPVESELIKAFRMMKEKEAAERAAKGETDAEKIPVAAEKKVSTGVPRQTNVSSACCSSPGCSHSLETAQGSPSRGKMGELSASLVEQCQSEAEAGSGDSAYRLYWHFKAKADPENAGIWLDKAVKLNCPNALYETGLKAMDAGNLSAVG
jgi:hypothetical protein